MPRRSAGGDAVATECARVSRAFESMLGAATANLLLHYAARLAAASATKSPSERAAAIAALEQERAAALAALRASIRQQRKEAIERARKAPTHDRFRVSVPAPRQKPLARSSERRLPRRGERLPTHEP
jgi:hypothetical protein